MSRGAFGAAGGNPEERRPQQRIAEQRRRGASLVELLVVVAFLAVIAGLAYGWYGMHGKGSAVADRVKTPPGKARGVACASNMRQIKAALQMAASSEDQPPQSLQAAARYGASGELLLCPETHKPYRYDPGRSLLICDTPGHPPMAVELQGR